MSAAIALSSLPVWANESFPKTTLTPIVLSSPTVDNLEESDREDRVSELLLLCEITSQLSQDIPDESDVLNAVIQGDRWFNQPVDLLPQWNDNSTFEVSSEALIFTQVTPSKEDTDSDNTAPDDTIETQPESAQPNPDVAQDRWQFLVQPYFFVPFNVQTDITVRGRTLSIESGLGDIFDLDRIFAASVRLEAQKKRFGFILDGSYLSVGKDGKIDVTIPASFLQDYGIDSDVDVSANVSADARQGVLDLAAFYRVVDMSLGDNDAVANSYPRLVVEPILGARLNWLSQEINIDTIRIGGTEVPDEDVELSTFFIEPMLGFRVGLELSERWAVGLRGDISGFDINADRNLTWNLLVGTQYRLSNNIALQFAYRFTDFEYQSGDGTDRLGLNLQQQGLWLGAVFRF